MTGKKDRKNPLLNPEQPLTIPTEFLSIKLGKAAKNGPRAKGFVHYRILKDQATDILYFMMVGNDGKGCYSPEAIPFTSLFHCIKALPPKTFIASKVFQPVFVGKSTNNPGFLAAILHAEGLLQPAPDKVHLHQIHGNWPEWQAQMQALSGEVFIPPEKVTRGKKEPLSNTASTQNSDTPKTMTTHQETLEEDPISFLMKHESKHDPATKHQHPDNQKDTAS